MIKRLSKYIASFDYFEKSLIFLSATSGSISIASFVTVTGAPVAVASSGFSLVFSMSTGIVKKLLKITQNKMEKHNKIVILARSKLNSIESKISETLINNEISYEDFTTIINEEKTMVNSKKALEWWKLKEVTLKEVNWLKKVKENGLIKSLDKMLSIKQCYLIV